MPKGFSFPIDEQPAVLSFRDYELLVEEHPRYTFHLESPIPDEGRLLVRDTNFATSEGTSRLAVRGRDGVKVKGDDLPADVDQIPIRPVWQLSDDEQRRTTEVSVRYHREDGGLHGSPGLPSRVEIAPESTSAKANGRLNGISDLLDKTRADFLVFVGFDGRCAGRGARGSAGARQDTGYGRRAQSGFTHVPGGSVGDWPRLWLT